MLAKMKHQEFFKFYKKVKKLIALPYSEPKVRIPSILSPQPCRIKRIVNSKFEFNDPEDIFYSLPPRVKKIRRKGLSKYMRSPDDEKSKSGMLNKKFKEVQYSYSMNGSTAILSDIKIPKETVIKANTL